jgi:hypothetical protein
LDGLLLSGIVVEKRKKILNVRGIYKG